MITAESKLMGGQLKFSTYFEALLPPIQYTNRASHNISSYKELADIYQIRLYRG